MQDFNNSIITITFDADEDAAISEKRAPVPIFDDAINEAIEQYFVVQLSLASSLNPAGVDISSRAASLGRIIDNDRKCIQNFAGYLSLCMYVKESWGNCDSYILHYIIVRV